MSIFSRLFSKKKKEEPHLVGDFSEGDIFYTQFDDQYHLYKLLVFEKDFECYHVLGYKPLDILPGDNNMESLEVAVYHSPVDRNAFRDAKLLKKDTIAAGELMGYHEYLRQTREPEYYVTLANEYYQAGIHFTDHKNYDAAIDAYAKAIDLIPEFFEAIDNRAFCKMDLGKWPEAIADFEASLSVNPGSLLAEFSIGECYLQMANYQKAKEQFEKAVAIDPTHQLSKELLVKVNALLGVS